MEYKVIINAIIIIFIIYLILENINFNYIFNLNKKNNIPNNNIPNNTKPATNEIKENYQNNKSIDFLVNDDDFIYNLDSLEKKKNCKDNEIDKNYVKPGNFWLEENKNPNFESNVINVSKYYDINMDELSTPLDEINNFENKYNDNELKKVIDYKQAEQSCFLNKGNEPFTTSNPDLWQYNDESPMNGGEMNNGIVGIDSLNSVFAKVDKNKFKFKETNCDDDLRNGMSTEAQEARLNND